MMLYLCLCVDRDVVIPVSLCVVFQVDRAGVGVEPQEESAEPK